MQQAQSHHGLPTGTVLNGVYTVEAELGQGGFGIVYRAQHCDLGLVAIKEYLPVELAVREGRSVQPRSTDSRGLFEEGLGRFQEEARQLIRFRNHPSIVSCRDFFRASGTAYLVMEFEEGLPLSTLLEAREASGKPFEEADLLAVMVPLLEGLARVHEAGVLHRDIKPSNILIRREDEQPVLIDFGAAKQEFALQSKSVAPYSPGYAAFEQVSEGRLGTWTDLYGVGAVMWRMVAGGNQPYDPPQPAKAERRVHAKFRGEPDPMPSAWELGKGRFSERVLGAIDRCLELGEQDRLQVCGELLRQMRGDEKKTSEPLPLTLPKGEGVGIWRQALDIKGAAAVLLAALVIILGIAFWRNWVNPFDERPIDDSSGMETPVDSASGGLGIGEEPAATTFSIRSDPASARVVFLGRREIYRSGMDLAQGSYQVEVSATGYKTRREWVEHDGTGPYRIELERLGSSFRVEPEPRDARIRVLNIGPPYRPGMKLSAGRYQVEVSAPGYVARRDWVEHDGTGPFRIELERLGTSFRVEVEPKHARISVLNIGRPYDPGMTLPAGRYQIEVRAAGYETYRAWMEHDGTGPYRIELERDESPPKPEVVLNPQEQSPSIPPQRVRVGGDVQRAKLVRQVRPEYPILARRARIRGKVVLEATISKQGYVDDLRVVNGHPLLNQSAVDAVKQWHYRPTVLNGVPVEVITRITVNFNLRE